MSTNLAGLPPRYLRTPEASRFVGLSIRTLEKHRIYGTGPRYSKLGGRVVYRVEDLQAWVDAAAKASTSDPGKVVVLPARRHTAGRTRTSPPAAPLTSPMSARHRTRSEREQLELFRALPGDLAPRDAQDLMAYPFFSLAKTHRTTPIDYRMNDIAIRVEAVPEHGMATIWDADVLIWAASQIVQARDSGLRTSRLMAATPYEILTFIGRGTSARDYHRLKAALRPLAVHHRRHLAAPGERAAHAPLLLDQRVDRARGRTRQRRRHRSHRAGLVLSRRPRRRARADDRPRIFRADGRTGALALPPRAQARRQAAAGWRFDFRHLHAKSASLSPFKRFAFELRDIARRQPLPGYRLGVDRASGGPRAARLRQHRFLVHRVLWTSCGRGRAIGNREARAIRNRILVLSGTGSGIFIKPIKCFRAA